MKRQLQEFLNNGISVLDTMSEQELINILNTQIKNTIAIQIQLCQITNMIF